MMLSDLPKIERERKELGEGCTYAKDGMSGSHVAIVEQVIM
jgi:hypothetical protein